MTITMTLLLALGWATRVPGPCWRSMTLQNYPHDLCRPAFNGFLGEGRASVPRAQTNSLRSILIYTWMELFNGWRCAFTCINLHSYLQLLAFKLHSGCSDAHYQLSSIRNWNQAKPSCSRRRCSSGTKRNDARSHASHH